MENKELITEKKLRKHEFLSGCWIRLGNGEKWCISPMPLGKRRKEIIEKIEAVDKAQLSSEKEVGFQAYDGVLEAAFNLTVAVLKINYPEITEEICDELCLVNIKHIPEIMSAVKGEREIEEISELATEKDFGASPNDGGGQKKSLTTA